MWVSDMVMGLTCWAGRLTNRIPVLRADDHRHQRQQAEVVERYGGF